MERLHSLPGAGTVSGGISLALDGGTIMDQLSRNLAEPFEPNMETLVRYQKRLMRSIEALEMSGEFMNAIEVTVLSARAEILNSPKSLGPEE